MYTHFTFKSGANPYITTTEEQKKRMLEKYKGKIEPIGDYGYQINDVEDEIDLFNFEDYGG